MHLSILFVEDNLDLIEGLVKCILREYPDADIEFAFDIPSSLDKLDEKPFDLVMLDIMLPAFADVPVRDEGIYLAAWILDAMKGQPSESFKKRTRPPWLVDHKPLVVLLSLRAHSGVSETWQKLTEGDREPVYIERLRGHSLNHWTTISNAWHTHAKNRHALDRKREER